MVDLRLTKRRAVEPGGSFARQKGGCENTSDQNQERAMIRKTMFAVATVAAIGAAALIPTEASAGGGGKGGGMGGGMGGHHGHWGHGCGGGYGSVVGIGSSCWGCVRCSGRVYLCE